MLAATVGKSKLNPGMISSAAVCVSWVAVCKTYLARRVRQKEKQIERKLADV